MGVELGKRYLAGFLKVGRTGKDWYVFGAPGKYKGPYKSEPEAVDVHTYILSNWQKFEVVDREVREVK